MSAAAGIRVIAESAAAWRQAECVRPELAAAPWATTAPYLVECLRAAGREVHCLDDQPQAVADAVGYTALAVSRRLADHLDEEREGWPGRLRPGPAMAPSAYRMFTSLFYKAQLLDRFLAAAPDGARTIAVGQDELTAGRGFELVLHRFDTLFSIIGRRIGLETISHQAPAPGGALANGDFLRPSFWTRAVTAMNAPVVSPLYRVWRGALRGRPVRLYPGRANRRVLIHEGNELIEEIFPQLLLRGARVWALARFAPEASAVEEGTDAGPLRATIEAIAREEWERHGLIWGQAAAAAAGMGAERIAAALPHGRHAASRVPDFCARLEDEAGSGTIGIVTNGLNSPAERLLRQGLEGAGIPVHVVDHGVGPGLDMLHKASFDAGLGEVSRGAILFNECHRAARAEVAGVPPEATTVAGAPRILRRIGFRALQRRAARRAVRAKGRLVVWNTALYANNYQFLPHYWRDTPYHALRKHIVHDILGKCRGEVLVKLYPTYRYVDPDPFAGLIELPANCRQVQFTDFRNLRAAADVLINETPGSVLGWSWGAGVPQIYLETGACPLLPAIEERFRRSLFFIDAREAGWAEKLTALLDVPDAELSTRYDAMADERAETGRHCILGPEGHAGARAARYVLDNLRRRGQAEKVAGAVIEPGA